MKIERIRIQNFRNLTSIYYEAHPTLNVFLGNNAQGKTSLLEAIYLLSRPISFRPGKDGDFLQEHCSSFMLEARCVQHDEPYKLTVRYDQEKKRKDFFRNEKKTTYKDGQRLKVVLFTPDDLYLIKGNPSRRRQFLDFILCQLSPSYEKTLSEYLTLLKRRNQLLRNAQRNSPGFQAVNTLLIQAASPILWERIRLTAFLDQCVQEIFEAIDPENSPVHLRYALSFPSHDGAIRKEDLSEGLEKQLQLLQEKEDQRLKTLAGPHLDDVNIYLNQRLARNFASQGQQRSIAVALKMAEVQVYRKIQGESPVFLLDEVLAELDLKKKQQLFDWLQQADFQSFLTAVALDGIQGTENVQMTRLKQGAIE